VTVLSVEGELVRRRLSGMTVVGREPDLSRLTDQDLGRLAEFAWRPEHWDRPLLSGLVQAIRGRNPIFDEAAALAALSALDAAARQPEEPSQRGVVSWMQEAAAQVVSGCRTFAAPPIVQALRDLLEQGLPGALDQLGAVLLSCARLPVPVAEDPLVQVERKFLCELPALEHRIIGARECIDWVFGVDDAELSPRGADPLALLPGYVAFAEGIVATALKRVAAIQSGELPYVSDGAFSQEGAQVLRRCLLAGLDQEASWAFAAALPLLAGVSRAPNVEVKTVPSQSATIALAKVLAQRPSPRLVAGMKRELSAIRHAGLKKKVTKFLQTAQRRMLDDDRLLLELDPNEEVPKGVATVLVRALEGLFVRESRLEFSIWKTQILEAQATTRHAASLIWDFGDAGAALPVRTNAGWSFVDSSGAAVAQPKGPVRLWHPLRHGSAADAWRRLVLAREIGQPFNQVFRETYTQQSIAALQSVDISVRTLLGLARSRGWRLEYGGCLLRKIGNVLVQLQADGAHYPGATGTTRCSAIAFRQASNGQRLDAASADPVLVSECLRAVDLLVGVSAFALEPESQHDSGTARARRAALVAMLGEAPREGRAFVDGRYVRKGELSISIATGQARIDGKELAAPELPRGVKLLPYPDETLGRIVARLQGQF
jgi:hypothetical protein